MNEQMFREQETNRPYSLDELLALQQKAEETVPTISYFVDQGKTVTEALWEIDACIQGMVAEFVKQKDRFSHVFQTEQGSWYFALPQASFRIRGPKFELRDGVQVPVRNYWDIESVVHHFAFVTRETADRILLDLKGAFYERESYSFETTPFAKGAVPIEFGSQGEQPRPDRVQQEGSLVTLYGFAPRQSRIHPDQQIEFKLNGYPIHVGHSITEIVK